MTLVKWTLMFQKSRGNGKTLQKHNSYKVRYAYHQKKDMDGTKTGKCEKK